MRKRNRHISVWMNEAEYRHLKTQAETAGMGIDPFIRTLVSGVNLRPRPPEEYADLLHQLAGIGNNLNQIAHIANSKQDISPDLMEKAIRLARQAWRLVKETF